MPTVPTPTAAPKVISMMENNPSTVGSTVTSSLSASERNFPRIFGLPSTPSQPQQQQQAATSNSSTANTNTERKTELRRESSSYIYDFFTTKSNLKVGGIVGSLLLIPVLLYVISNHGNNGMFPDTFTSYNYNQNQNPYSYSGTGAPGYGNYGGGYNYGTAGQNNFGGFGTGVGASATGNLGAGGLSGSAHLYTQNQQGSGGFGFGNTNNPGGFNQPNQQFGFGGNNMGTYGRCIGTECNAPCHLNEETCECQCVREGRDGLGFDTTVAPLMEIPSMGMGQPRFLSGLDVFIMPFTCFISLIGICWLCSVCFAGPVRRRSRRCN